MIFLIAKLIAVLVCLVAVCVGLLVRRVKSKRVKNIPVVDPPSLFSAIISSSQSHINIFDCIKKHNGIFQSRVAGDYMVFVAHPPLVHQTLTSVVDKGWIYEQTSFYPHITSIFSSNTADSKKIRPLFSSSFSINNVNHLSNNTIKGFANSCATR